MGSQLMISFWAWGDSEAETMCSLERLLTNLATVLGKLCALKPALGGQPAVDVGRAKRAGEGSPTSIARSAPDRPRASPSGLRCLSLTKLDWNPRKGPQFP